MKPHTLLLAAAAAVVAERAEPTVHFHAAATQRTGSTWVMSVSKHSSCIATGTELFLDHKGFKWTERAACAFEDVYGSDVDKKEAPQVSKTVPSEVRAPPRARTARLYLPSWVGTPERRRPLLRATSEG